MLVRWKCLGDWIALHSNYSVVRADWTYLERQSASTTGQLVANIYYNGTAYRPRSPFYAHVHAAVCASGSGGGHIKLNTSVSGAIQTNELWYNLSTTTTAAPLYTVSLMPNSPRFPDMSVAKSVVIHEAGNAKIACCDLSYWTPATLSPTPAPTSAAPTPAPTSAAPTMAPTSAAPTPAGTAAPTPRPSTAPPASSSSRSGPSSAVVVLSLLLGSAASFAVLSL